MRLFNLSIFFVLIFLILSCGKKNNKGSVKEGYIEYSMEYLNTNGRPVSNLLPKKMTITFKNQNTISKIESFSGIVSFTHITDKKKKKRTTLVKLLNKKFKYEESMELNSFAFESFPGMKFKHSDDIKEIAGKKCKKAIAYFPNNNYPEFEVYYTDQIQIKNPNKNTPFEEIDGVLMDFQVNMYNYTVRFFAESIENIAIENDDFSIPSDYKNVNKGTMEEIISLFN